MTDFDYANFDVNKRFVQNAELTKILNKIQGIKQVNEKTVLDHPVILKEMAKINHALYKAHLEKWIARIEYYIEKGGNIANLAYDMRKMLDDRYNVDFNKLQEQDKQAFMITARTETRVIAELLTKIEKLG